MNPKQLDFNAKDSNGNAIKKQLPVGNRFFIFG
jgi:hypothetical protein